MNTGSTKDTKGTWIEYNAEVPGNLKSSLLKGGITTHGFSGTSASILLTFANPGFPTHIASIDPAVQIYGHEFNTGQTQTGKNNKIGLFGNFKIVRIIGLMALISYMLVILSTWIFANLQGYMYFSAGEPVLSIKYPEWILGFIGIFVAADYLHRELNSY
ncbi:MAG TPA: hypothetical protein VKL21_00885 [Candidatus Methanoperedens sp.]|nr:hypothetical protein [Candidatus Methanoperedens sp.]